MERERGKNQEVQFPDKTVLLLGMFSLDMVAFAALRDPLNPENDMKIRTSRVANWALGMEEPDESARDRVEGMYEITKMMMDKDEHSDNIRSWFLGMNPDLEDRSPVMAIAVDIEAVKSAALGYIQGNN